MTWDETHRRWQALRTIEEQLSKTDARELPWTEEYAEIFGDRAGLVAALRYRWQLAVDAQLDTHLPEQVLEEQRRRLELRSRGVRRLLDTQARGEEGAQRVVA
jgi:hypothetical protein